jgi:hypothetical protein
LKTTTATLKQEVRMNELGEFHHAEDRPDTRKKIVAAVIVATILAGGAFYAAESGMFNHTAKHTGQAYPRGL